METSPELILELHRDKVLAANGRRWRDVDDVLNVIAVQESLLDWSYIERWCRGFRTLEMLQKIRSEAEKLAPA